MQYISRSLAAMSFALAAASLYLVEHVLRLSAYLTLAPSTYSTSRDLFQADSWVSFAAAMAALIAVCAAGWESVLAKAWQVSWEMGALVVGTLMIAIGFLIVSLSPSSTTAAGIVTAVGIGIWGITALVRAALASLNEQATDSDASVVRPPRQAASWLVAAVSLLFISLDWGIPQTYTSKSADISAGSLEALGSLLLIGAIIIASSRGYLRSNSRYQVVAGVSFWTIGAVAYSVVAGLQFGPLVYMTMQSWRGIRVGMSIYAFIDLVGAAFIVFAAWTKVRELVLSSRRAGRDSAIHAVPESAY